MQFNWVYYDIQTYFSAVRKKFRFEDGVSARNIISVNSKDRIFWLCTYFESKDFGHIILWKGTPDERQLTFLQIYEAIDRQQHGVQIEINGRIVGI